MRILLVKTTSLGDVIHNLPVVSDLRQYFPQATIDWCVEESFAAIPRLHPGVNDVIPVAVRRWRKRLWSATIWHEIGGLKDRLHAEPYDLIIDTQGLVKSAIMARQAQGLLCGYAADSIREPLAAKFYDQHFHISRQLHAVERNRQLVAAACGYDLANTTLNYGITAPAHEFVWHSSRAYAVLLSATSRDDKLWPESHWLALGQGLHEQGLVPIFPSGSAKERERAQWLANTLCNRGADAIAAPPLSIPELACLLAEAKFVVGVDTGLTHLAAALPVPVVALYTATDPGLTGVFGSGFHVNLGGAGQVPSVAAVLAELAKVDAA